MTHYAMYTHWLCVWVGGVNVYTDIHYPCSFMISLSLHEVYYTQGCQSLSQHLKGRAIKSTLASISCTVFIQTLIITNPNHILAYCRYEIKL